MHLISKLKYSFCLNTCDEYLILKAILYVDNLNFCYFILYTVSLMVNELLVIEFANKKKRCSGTLSLAWAFQSLAL